MTNGKADRYAQGGVDSGLDENSTGDQSSTQSDTESTGEIPHRIKYDSPKEARSEVQFMLGDEDSQRLGELEALAKREFDEKVFRTDVYLAGLRAGIESTDEQFLSEMRTIGYDYFD